MTLLQQLKWRYATKKFDKNRQISKNDLAELTEALRLAPSSFGLQPWAFVHVTDMPKRLALQECAWNQTQVSEASELFVLCARTDVDNDYIKKYVASVAMDRGISVESLQSYSDMMTGHAKTLGAEKVLEWNKKQVYIASGFLMLAAATKHIDTCPMEGFDTAKADEILGLAEKNLTACLLMPIGYRANDDKYAQAKKVRFDEDDVIVEM